jgi:hypothetical protein
MGLRSGTLKRLFIGLKPPAICRDTLANIDPDLEHFK